jgi:UDP-N-acetylmuramyl pentapeptide phosphotransferase/UDP-N-acetylglucosamine-1-phosphate transferase
MTLCAVADELLMLVLLSCCLLQVLPFKADTLRGAAVITATIGFLTYNLPPLAEAPRLWHRVAGIVG